ncbi:MAG: hypothetical protein ACE148_12805 [Vicinamibacterales bacterium]
MAAQHIPADCEIGTTNVLLALVALGAIAAAVEPAAATIERLSIWGWTAILAAVLALPFVAQWVRKQSLEPFTPITYPVLTYLAPAFIVGSVVLGSGLARQPMHPGLIPEPEARYFCAALAYLALGWLALTAGFWAAPGAVLGGRVGRLLPRVDWRPNELRWPAACLVIAGACFNWVALREGLLGFQMKETVGSFDALTVFVTFLLHLGEFLLWYSLFRKEKWTTGERLLAVALLLLSPFHLIVSGSRATLVNHLLVLAFGFRLAGRRVLFRSLVLFGIVAVLEIGLGMLWGTTYREIKGSEAPIASPAEPPAMPPVAPPAASETSAVPPLSGTTAARSEATAAPPAPVSSQFSSSEFGRLVSGTFHTVLGRGLGESALYALQTTAKRVEITSCLAVVVGNYRRLKAEEESAGIAGNIWRSTWTAPIPRVVWPGKPHVAIARTYSQVYFHYGGVSYPITPVGDLLRNFGALGIPLGMALLGLALRVLFAALVEGRPPDPAAAGFYTLILMNVSYEGFYATILPHVARVGVVTIAGLVFVHAGIILLRRFRAGFDRPAVGQQDEPHAGRRAVR